jgi:hypothetical protein
MKNTTSIPAALIPARTSEPITVIEITDRITSMYEAIGCDLVERVSLDSHYKACLWVDEEGILHRLPMNIRASCLAGRPIFGNAIMAGEDAEYNIVPLSLACPKMFFDFLEEEAVRFVYEVVKEEISKSGI